MRPLRIAMWSAGLMLLAGFTPWGARAAEVAAAQARPNVILCMTDDQGWNDVSYNEQGALARGKVKTPNLDAMAAAGLRFDHKLVVGGAKGRLESVALYDLVEDLGERKNLAAEKPEIVARMRPALEAWKASVERSATGADYARPLP